MDQISNLLNPNEIQNIQAIDAALAKADETLLKIIQRGKEFAVNPEAIKSLTDFNNSMAKLEKTTSDTKNGVTAYEKSVLAAQKAEIALVESATRRAEAIAKSYEKQILAAQKAEIAAIESAAKRAQAEQDSYNKQVLAAQKAEIKAVESATRRFQKEKEQHEKRVLAAEKAEMKMVQSATVAAEKMIKIKEREAQSFNQLEAQYKEASRLAKNLAVDYVLLEQKIKAATNPSQKNLLQNQLVGLGAQLKQAQANAIGLSNTINAVNASVGQHQTKVGNYTGAISGYFNNLKSQFIGFTGAAIGFFAIISRIREGVNINAELSDAFADLKIRIHGTNEDVQNLVGTLRNLDTRSSLTSLVDIAAIIAKKGVAKEEIAGVTKAVDDLMIAVGKEMGDPHQAVSSLIKLSTIYNDDKNVTAKKIVDIGNAIQKLTSSGIATGQYLIEFAEQMGGIRGVTHMTVDSVLGLGAALEALGQTAHVSSTALSQVIVKLFTEQQKYADLTKNSLGDFQQMLHKDVLGTLLLVAQAIKGDAGEMEHFFEGMVDMHAKGYRAVGVIGDLAAAIPYAKMQMEKATVSMKEQNRTMDAANEKQHTFAATIDRIGKSFEMAASQPGFMNFLDGIGKSIIFLIQHIPELIALGTLLIVNWAAQNLSLVALRAQLIGYNIALAAYRIALGAVTIVQTAYTVGVGIMTGAIRVATGVQWLFNNALFGTKAVLGSFLAILGFAIAAIELLYLATHKSISELKAHGNQLVTNAQILEKVNEQTADVTQKIKTLTSIVKDNNVSLDIRNKALKDLISIAPEYLSSLTLENLKMAEGNKILDNYIESLRAKAALEAAQKQESEIVERDVKLQNIEFALEKKKFGGANSRSDVWDEVKKLSDMDIISKNLPIGGDPFDTYVNNLIKKVKSARLELKKELDITDEIVKDRYKKNAAFNPAKQDAAVMGSENEFNRFNTPVGSLNSLPLTRLKSLLESVAKEYDKLTASAEDLKKSRVITDYYDEVQKRIDLIEGKQSKSGGKKNGLTSLPKNLDGEKKLIEALEKLTDENLKNQLEKEKEITDNIKAEEQERLDALVRFTDIKNKMAYNEFAKEVDIQKQLTAESLEKEKSLQFRISELKSGRGNMRDSQRKAYIDEVKKEITNEEKLRQSYIVNQEMAMKKYNAQFTQNQINHTKKTNEIRKTEEAEYLKERELQFAEQQQVEIQGYIQQEFLLKDQLDQGLITRGEYYNKLKALKASQDTQSINVEVDFYKAILDEEKLVHRMSLEELREYQRKYDSALQKQFDNQNNKKPKRDQGRPTDFIVDALAGKGISDEDLIRAKKDYWNKTVDLAKTAYSAIKTIRDNDFQQQQMNLDRERQTLETKSRQRIRAIQAESGYEITKNNKIALIEAQTAAKEDELQKRSNDLALKKAVADKENAQLEVVANTATAIMATYAAYAGVPGGTLIATGIAGLLTGIGAAQYAAVSSTPLPQYWTGTGPQGTTAPMFTAGERGFELIQPVGKPAYFSSDTTKAYSEPLGTKISSHEQTVRLIQYAVGNVINQPNHSEKDIAKEIGKIIGDKFDESVGEFAYAVAKTRTQVNVYNNNRSDNLTWKIR